MAVVGDVRRHVEVQGFSGLSPDDFRRVVPWMRFPAAMNFAANTIGTLLRIYAGYVLGGIMSGLMLPLVTVHFCVVSEILDRVIGSPGRGDCRSAPQFT